jgi:hypothetical protein
MTLAKLPKFKRNRCSAWKRTCHGDSATELNGRLEGKP